MTPLEAYRIIQRRQISEDRILAERASMFLLATAFLFVAFVMLLDPDWTGRIFTALRFILPILGILLTVLLYIFNLGTTRALVFWHKAQLKIEKDAADFDYMRSNGLTPHIDQDAFLRGEKKWVEVKGTLVLKTVKKPNWQQKLRLRNSHIYKYGLPIAFFALWSASLVYVVVS